MQKEVFLEILQNSQENTWAKINNCNFIKKETVAQVFFRELCEICKSTFFYRTPPVAASGLLWLGKVYLSVFIQTKLLVFAEFFHDILQLLLFLEDYNLFVIKHIKNEVRTPVDPKHNCCKFEAVSGNHFQNIKWIKIDFFKLNDNRIRILLWMRR